MDKSKYNKITLTKKQAKEQQNVVDLLTRIKGTIVKNHLFSKKITLYVLKPKRNYNISGKGFFIKTPYETSGIIHK